jgi:hypothetical protein
MKKIQQLLSRILLSVLLVLFQTTSFMQEALASSINEMPTAESVESSYSLQSRRCASDRLRSKFIDLLNVLPNGAHLNLSQPDRDNGGTKTVATCEDDFTCDLLAAACDELGGVGQCGGEENSTGCQCVY